ncbi:molybdopterin-dependent oxidoreductase [Ilumatobacter nonamiensis]|uniref:molybdopterin-dependent oxidoreductase n=1 Tax=Ilumatobacter nonamiensis TaxID=467093 RepID=UPI00034C12C3|nr:molybdopterin-dependent oxidoreductase [Ilumatobacter nonamiensis]
MTGDARNAEEAERERRLREQTDDGEIISKEEYTKRSRRAFLSFAGLGVAGYLGFRQVQNMEEDENIPRILRAGFDWNESVWSTLERDGARARTFSVDDREEIRVNGRHGLEDGDGDFIEVSESEAETWEIEVTSRNGSTLDPIPLAAVKSDFEVHDMVWEHKCIEGWSNIVHWTGVRLSDVLERYAADELSAEWSVLRTPPGNDVRREYSSAIENYTMRHAQTLLAWELNGEPLTAGHGSPIRLVTPFKYGIKQIKRVGSIEFTDDRPTDYWTERGYDLHSSF